LHARPLFSLHMNHLVQCGINGLYFCFLFKQVIFHFMIPPICRQLAKIRTSRSMLSNSYVLSTYHIYNFFGDWSESHRSRHHKFISDGDYSCFCLLFEYLPMNNININENKVEQM
jgi:hypothetical protein